MIDIYDLIQRTIEQFRTGQLYEPVERRPQKAVEKIIKCPICGTWYNSEGINFDGIYCCIKDKKEKYILRKEHISITKNAIIQIDRGQNIIPILQALWEMLYAKGFRKEYRIIANYLRQYYDQK